MGRKIWTEGLVKSRLLLVLFISLLSLELEAQEIEPVKDSVVNKNILKLNVPSLFISTFNLQWERRMGPRSSIALGALTRLDRPIFNYIDRDERSPLADIQQRTLALTPEIKYYLKGDVFEGIYVGIYGRWRTDKLVFDYLIDGTDNKTNYNWNDRMLHVGGLIGYQFYISKDVYVDIWCVGIGLKYSRIDAVGISNYDNSGANRYTDMFNLFDGLFQRSFGFQVDGRTSNLDGESLRADFRGAGICLGVRF